MAQHTFLAFDLGATSGRSILGTLENGKLHMQELTRFPNGPIQVGKHFHWNIFSLLENLKEGLRTCVKSGVTPTSVGIDTWGVDFGLLDKDGALLGIPYAYRDPHTNGMPEKYFAEKMPRREVYEATGIQVMNFNSIFQLFALKQNGSPLVDVAKSLLFIPDLLAYFLTGKKRCEFTFATTSQLFNPRTMQFEKKLLEAMGVSPELMQPLIMPGEEVGKLTAEVAEETGMAQIPLVAVGTHDTASAVLAVPAQGENFAYLSSGTWSLMGLESKKPIINDESYKFNYTNEGGVGGTIRFLKNITGLWLLERCKVEWAKHKDYTYPELVDMAKSEFPFRFFVDPDAPEFANPASMTKAIVAYCERTKQEAPATDAEFVRCIFDSLAMKYRYTLEKLKDFASHPIEKLHVIGGGAKNALLNQLTANAIGIPVMAGPAEATAIGNIMVQAMAAGCVKSVDEARAVIRASVQPDVYQPQDAEAWAAAFKKFLTVVE
ncbi:MAG: rhamnulokinase [Prevotellaceae bacterium]|jgi:rhamnulokinase|nr:rhamnulokinase [Prevotellaceae bacterium]